MNGVRNSKLSATFTVLAMLTLSGCATMSADECITSDWHAIGFEDGARGHTMDRMSQHRKACAKHGVTPDFRAYQTGRDEGLVDFCQPANGYNLGVNGGNYNGVCDVAMEEEFLDAYRVGSQLYTLRSNVNHANNRIYSKEREIEKIGDTIREQEALLISDQTTTEDRVRLLADLKELAERRGELETEIDMLIADRAKYEYELADYERTVAAYGF